MLVDKVTQKRRWRLHRKRVKRSQCIVDQKAPNIHVNNYLRITRLKEDGNTFMRMLNANVGLLMHIGYTMQTTGMVKSFNRTLDMLPSCRMKMKRDMLDLIDQRNFAMGVRIIAAKADLHTRAVVFKEQKLRRRRAIRNFKVPWEILSKYQDLKMPICHRMRYKFLRPLIFFDLELRGIRKLGRILIELYTEAAPQIVGEFVRACRSKKAEHFQFRRLFPLLWLESELMLNPKTLAKQSIEYDLRAIDHNSGPGILSFPRHYLKGIKRGFLDFSISFKPLRVLNGKRVAFGRVTSGLEVLDFIRDFGMRNGKPTKPIGIRSCGWVS